MEPIVLLGLIAVVYGGYISILDLLEDVSALFPRRTVKVVKQGSRRECSLKPPIKKMAGMHV